VNDELPTMEEALSNVSDWGPRPVQPALHAVDAMEGLLPLDDEFDGRALSRGSRPAPSRRKPEGEIVLEGINYLRAQPHAYAKKVHGGAMGNAGEPDVDACVRGRAVKLEAKAGSNTPSKVQLAALRRWAAAGALVGWFTTNQHIVELLDHLEDHDYITDLSAPGCAKPCHREEA
jgi:hypothetical protein